MPDTPTAHVDTFCRTNLPPRSEWPQFVFDLPELRYPESLNSATALLDDTIARHGGIGPACSHRAGALELRPSARHREPHGGDRPCLLAPGRALDLRRLLGAANRVAHVLTDELGIVPGQPGAAARTEQPVAGRLLVRGAQGRCGGGDHDAPAARP